MTMAPPTPVKAAMLPDIPHRLQRDFAQNKANLEKANIWEYLLWVKDVEKKAVNEDKVTQFVHSYQLKNKLARVRGVTVDFSTLAISRVTALPDEGMEFDKLPDLRKEEAEEIFAAKFKWGNDTIWDYGTARQHWKAWFAFVNIYILFRPFEQRMEQKYVVAAIRCWEGTALNRAKLVQQRMNDEIQERKATNPEAIHLYSAFYISCLCENVSVLVGRLPPNHVFPSGPPSPTSDELDMQTLNTTSRIAELEKQLSDQKDKIE